MNFEPLGCALMGFVNEGVVGWYVYVAGPDADFVVNVCHQDFSLLDLDFAGKGCIVASLFRVTSPIHPILVKGIQNLKVWTEWPLDCPGV